jgi:hypothetical protein
MMLARRKGISLNTLVRDALRDQLEREAGPEQP